MITDFFDVRKTDETENAKVFEKCGRIIREGGLVAFPTETVYGLGGNALDGAAVRKIYEAKGRPSDNPLIVHISRMEQLEEIVSKVSENARRLADRFWPGPLTLVFKKKDHIPYETTGGLDTVAVRFPANEYARALIDAAGVPIAAPSANSSGKPSPTLASHVKTDLDGKIDAIIDGGACLCGLESTIIDASGDVPVMLRPGSVTKEMAEEAVGEIILDKAVVSSLSAGEVPKAPGMKYKHYSPKAKVTIVLGKDDDVCREIKRLVSESESSGKKACALVSEETKGFYAGNTIVLGKRSAPETIAANLFAVLRKCDDMSCDVVFSEGFDETKVGLAIMNRLKKAAGYDIIKV